MAVRYMLKPNLTARQPLRPVQRTTKSLLTYMVLSFLCVHSSPDLFAYERKFGFDPPPISAPSFQRSSGEQLGQAIVLVELLKQRKEQELLLQQQAHEQEELERLRQEEYNRITAAAENIRQVLVQLKKLSDKIPPTNPGPWRFIQGFFTELRSQMGYLPELIEYRRLLQANKTLSESMVFPNIAYDTFDVRALYWDGVFETYNLAVLELNRQFPFVTNSINKQHFMTLREIGRVAILHGIDPRNLTDDELKEAFQGDITYISKDALEIYRSTCRERAIECEKDWSRFWSDIIRNIQARFRKPPEIKGSEEDAESPKENPVIQVKSPEPPKEVFMRIIENMPIIESGLAKDVDNLWLGSSVEGVSRTFSVSDRKITWYAKFDGSRVGILEAFTKEPKFAADWYSPSGELFSRKEFNTAFGNFGLARNTLDFSKADPSKVIGNWRVEIWHRGQLVDKVWFEIQP